MDWCASTCPKGTDLSIYSHEQLDEIADQIDQINGRPRKGHTGQRAKAAAAQNGIALEVVKLAQAKKGFVLLPRRWVVERSFGWLARFRRLSRDYERLPDVLGGLHFVVFAMLMLPSAMPLIRLAQSS